MLGLGRASPALGAGLRHFRSSASLQQNYFKGRNANRPKKLKKQVLPEGHLKPHIWKAKQTALRAKELKEKFAEIENVPVVHWKPPTLQSWVLNFHDATPVGIVPLDRNVWGAEIRKDVVHRVVRWQRAKWRQGTHKSKTRAEVRGGGRKPTPQKGTGNARQGSTRASNFKGGGKAHGPVPRSHAFKLPVKVLKMGMRSALSAKFGEGNMFVIKDTLLDTHKTAEFMEIVQAHWKPLEHSRIALVHTEEELDPNMALAARNVWNFDFYTPYTANVYDMVKRHHLIITESGLKAMENLLTRPHLGTRVNFPVERPLAKLDEVGIHRFHRVKRKQATAMRIQQEKADKQVLIQKIKAVQQSM
jgi:large subunit ribosomal protein L4